MIYLYVKHHSDTGLKYFGKTIKNPFKYNGSGFYWKSHIKKHGIDKVKTIEIWGFDDQDLCTEFALKFSRDNNIVESENWANLMDENGSTGGGNQSIETRYKQRNLKLGIKKSESHIKCQSEVRLGKKRGPYNWKNKNYILCSCCLCKRTIPTSHHKCV